MWFAGAASPGKSRSFHGAPGFAIPTEVMALGDGATAFFRSCTQEMDGSNRRGRVYLGGMSEATQALGLVGEQVAERWLRGKGWRVVQRRFRSGHRDIDLVVERDGVVAFVEVKARSGDQFGDPVEAVNWRKRRELTRSASVWVDRHGREGDSYRFDVVGVLISGGKARVRHVEHAFEMQL